MLQFPLFRGNECLRRIQSFKLKACFPYASLCQTLGFFTLASNHVSFDFIYFFSLKNAVVRENVRTQNILIFRWYYNQAQLALANGIWQEETLLEAHIKCVKAITYYDYNMKLYDFLFKYFCHLWKIYRLSVKSIWFGRNAFFVPVPRCQDSSTLYRIPCVAFKRIKL